MLRFRKRPHRLITGDEIFEWIVPIEVRRQRNIQSVPLRFLVDSGAQMTNIPIGNSIYMGLTPEEIRKQGIRLPVKSSAGTQYNAYLYPVYIVLKDNFGGYAEWETEVLFSDVPDTVACLAGHLGFLNFFEIRSEGEFINLEPIAQPPGQFFDCHCGYSVSAS